MVDYLHVEFVLGVWENIFIIGALSETSFHLKYQINLIEKLVVFNKSGSTTILTMIIICSIRTSSVINNEPKINIIINDV